MYNTASTNYYYFEVVSTNGNTVSLTAK